MIRLAHPRFGDGALSRVGAALDSGMLTSGRLVAALEEGLSPWVGGREVILVSSGTTAALLGFHLLRDRGVRRLLMPDFTFPSVAASALRLGLEIELCDIDPERLSLPPAALDGWPEGPAHGVVSIDQFGIPGPNAALSRRVAAAGQSWFEDAACAQGSLEGEVPCASQATVAILSFHPRKVMTTAEGGALVTGDGALAQAARELRSLGLTGQGMARQFSAPGYNARLSEVHAALGLDQLERFPEMLARRRELGRCYLSRLASRPDIEVPAGFRLPGINFQSLVVLLPPDVDRDETARRLYGAGIESTLPGFAIHTQPAFAALARRGPLVHSLDLHRRGLSLPLHDGLTEDDVARVVTALGDALTRREA
jgi:perosamine synthetase